MKKVLFGLVLGMLIALPMGAFAWTKQQTAKPIYGVDCRAPNQYTDSGKWVKDYNGMDCSTTVYVFDDANNKCYVTKGANASGISCVKE